MKPIKQLGAAQPIRKSNSHGCVKGICRCPRSYVRCSLFTNYPELHTDPKPEDA